MKHIIIGTIEKQDRFEVKIFKDQLQITYDTDKEAIEFIEKQMAYFFRQFRLPTAVVFKRNGHESVLMYDVEDGEVEFIEVSLTEYWKQHYFYRKDQFDESKDKHNLSKDFYYLDAKKSEKLWKEEQKELEEMIKGMSKEDIYAYGEKIQKEFDEAVKGFVGC